MSNDKLSTGAFYTKRLVVLICCYAIRRELNAIHKEVQTLPDDNPLKVYVNTSRILKIGSFIDKFTTELRQVTQSTELSTKSNLRP